MVIGANKFEVIMIDIFKGKEKNISTINNAVLIQILRESESCKSRKNQNLSQKLINDIKRFFNHLRWKLYNYFIAGEWWARVYCRRTSSGSND